MERMRLLDNGDYEPMVRELYETFLVGELTEVERRFSCTCLKEMQRLLGMPTTDKEYIESVVQKLDDILSFDFDIPVLRTKEGSVSMICKRQPNPMLRLMPPSLVEKYADSVVKSDLTKHVEKLVSCIDDGNVEGLPLYEFRFFQSTNVGTICVPTSTTASVFLHELPTSILVSLKWVEGESYETAYIELAFLFWFLGFRFPKH